MKVIMQNEYQRQANFVKIDFVINVPCDVSGVKHVLVHKTK